MNRHTKENIQNPDRILHLSPVSCIESFLYSAQSVNKFLSVHQPCIKLPVLHCKIATDLISEMSVKLYYFDVRGLAEPIRMIFAIGGIEYEDIRAPLEQIPASLPAEFKESKSTFCSNYQNDSLILSYLRILCLHHPCK
jgi:hypothetical protein